MEHMARIDKPKKYADAIIKTTYKCKCGHSVIIPAFVNKQICGWCGKYVYKDEKSEFKDRLMKEIKKRG